MAKVPPATPKIQDRGHCGLSWQTTRSSVLRSSTWPPTVPSRVARQTPTGKSLKTELQPLLHLVALEQYFIEYVAFEFETEYAKWKSPKNRDPTMQRSGASARVRAMSAEVQLFGPARHPPLVSDVGGTSKV